MGLAAVLEKSQSAAALCRIIALTRRFICVLILLLWRLQQRSDSFLDLLYEKYPFWTPTEYRKGNELGCRHRDQVME
tara:strand:+ start:2155 stop:2385 length:231 start_codon:yes stop_codon:yes gene_type:complete